MSELRQNWQQLAVVQIGGAICLPIFVVGHALAKTYGLHSAILAILVGNLMLLVLGCVVAWASASYRQSTAELAVDLFGTKGKGFFSAALVLSMVGWFAIQLNIMTLSLQTIIGRDLALSGNVCLGILITLAGIKGMRGLTTLANISMPILLLTIAYAIYNASHTPVVVKQSQAFTCAGISLALATAIGAVIDLPTFFRIAKSPKDGIIAIIVLFGFVLPLIEAVGVYLYVHSQGENILEVLASPSSPKLWKLWILGFLLLAGWTTNNANLYSASVSMKTLLPRLTDTARILSVGAVGTLLSCLNFLDNMAAVLDVIGIILASMGAVMIGLFLSKKGSSQPVNFIVWNIGLIGGFLSLYGYGLTGIPVLDAFLVAIMSTGAILLLNLKNAVEYEKRSARF
ncbi:MAG: cytosine permease [Waddliaceae bacterium]